MYNGAASDVPESLRDQQVAPPHPDVEGQNPETKNARGEGQASEQPPRVDIESDQEKEQSIANGKKAAKPASEGNEATGVKQEL